MDGVPSQLRKCFIKLVIIGDSSVGKTSLIQMFEHSKFSQNFKPTIGADFSNKEITLDDNRVVTLQIWDTAGQERFQSLGSAFYRGADCCVLVYDISNQASFDHLMNQRQVFLIKSDPREPQTLPFLVLGNKCDVPEEQKKVSSIDAKRFCQQNGNILFYETSAKDNVNVEKAFKELIIKVLKRQEEMNKILGLNPDIIVTAQNRTYGNQAAVRIGQIQTAKKKKNSSCCK
ncbi:rab small monomeric gtpase [Stylonychia lemnae]|uniref:Ras-related protein Rab-7b n=1 Tax=Stylonychia lemnae TaxID=5949 RepID=A0A078ASM2_STYLE|nr:rab small monomeric gtpase [Stylonychia lemnae]|eukprot:CDW84202.1 rab small monomeric gtpase [Stylonychia lemnae]